MGALGPRGMSPNLPRPSGSPLAGAALITVVFPWSETGMLGNFGVASRVHSSISNFKMERGTSLVFLLGELAAIPANAARLPSGSWWASVHRQAQMSTKGVHLAATTCQYWPEAASVRS